MSVSITEFKKAVLALSQALAEPKSDIVRDAAIRRFNISIELAWRTGSKKLGLAPTAPKIVIREMIQAGFIQDLGRWLSYIDFRNLIPYAYNEALAEKIFDIAQSFLPEANDLLMRLETESH